MTGKTHFSAGLIAGTGAAIALALPASTASIFVGCAALGSLLPDIDHPNSRVGRKALPVSVAINVVAGHRKLFHSLLPYVAGVIALTVLFPEYKLYALALGMGCLLHLFLDSLTPEGVPFLYPFSKHRTSFLKIRTGGVWEWLFSVGMIAISSYFFYCSII